MFVPSTKISPGRGHSLFITDRGFLLFSQAISCRRYTAVQIQLNMDAICVM